MAVTYSEAPAGEAPVVETPQYCAQQPVTKPLLPPDLSADRLSAILVGRTKWVNGTVLRYFLLNEGDGHLRTQLDAVRQAFRDWEGIGIGLEFLEVDQPSQAEVRIGFDWGDGSWSYVGRDVLNISTRNRTMNFGWDLTSRHGKATALHEIGHTLGFAHEHQNPFAGIVWDEEKVYASLAGPPNNWPREQTFHNILRKLSTSEVEGSTWDPESIMEYPFGPGLIIQPEKYRSGIADPLNLSELDKKYVQRWYPPLAAKPAELHPLQSTELDLAAGEQADFAIVPTETRMYEIGAFGDSDVVMVLFEEVDGEQPRYFTADDDSGAHSNARLKVRLFEGRRYILRTRLYSAWGPGKAALMVW